MHTKSVRVAVATAILLASSTGPAAAVEILIGGQSVSVKVAKALARIETEEYGQVDPQGEPFFIMVPTGFDYGLELVAPAAIPLLDAQLPRDAGRPNFDVVLPDGTSFSGCIVAGFSRKLDDGAQAAGTKYSVACADVAP